MIDPPYLNQKLKIFRELGVKISDDFKLGDMKGHYNIVMSFESQFAIVDILGEKIGYENIELEPRKSQSNSKYLDVDIIVHSDYDYHIQNKTPYFSDSKYGRRVDECVREDFYGSLGSRRGIFLKNRYTERGNFSYRREVKRYESNADFGVFLFEPSFYNPKYLESKFRKILREANTQLTESEGVKMISIDVRFFPIGEDVIHSIIRRFLDNPKLKYICCLLLLTHNIATTSNHLANRLIPIINYNYYSDYSVFDYNTFGMENKIPLYSRELLVLAARIKAEKKGWNEFITIENGKLMHDGVVFGKLF